MKKKPFFYTLCIVLTALGLNRCATEKKSISAILPPFKNVDVAYKDFTVDASTGATLTSESGTRIIVPADAMQDERGNVYTGKAIVKYREFHSSADILASGIPMSYDSGGVKMDFQSAGMFELLAETEDHKPLSLKEGKEVTVNMASYVDGSQYNFYSLNADGKWTFEGKSGPTLNEQKATLLKALPVVPASPVEPQEVNDKEKVFNLAFDEREHPELKGFSDVVWQYSGKPGDRERDPAFHTEVFSTSWERVELGKFNEKTMSFDLVLSAGKKKFETVVKPVLKGKRLKKAKEEFASRFVKYKEVKDQRENMEKVASQQGDFIRSFTVQNFGVHNWDCVLNQPGRMAIKADFKFDGEVNLPASSLVAYLVTGSDRSLITYAYENWDKFSFDPGADNKLIIILPGNKMAIFDEGAFRKLDITQIRNQGNYTFKLKIINTPVSSMDDLKKTMTKPMET